MVNASLNWASIVGIALAVCGAGLYFLRSFKPALARDYDVFFAAIGLLCGGILFFQGWRLDPILQFGQFLLAGTTVFFAYESVRLRGVATDQARRSSYFDDETPLPRSSREGLNNNWQDDEYDQFEEAQPISRRFAGRDFSPDTEDPVPSRRSSRAAIPEEAVSRRPRPGSPRDSFGEGERFDSDNQRRMERFRRQDLSPSSKSRFGDRRTDRSEVRRGNRLSANEQISSRRMDRDRSGDISSKRRDRKTSDLGQGYRSSKSSQRNTSQLEDAAFSSSSFRTNKQQKKPARKRGSISNRPEPSQGKYQQSSPKRNRPRDNSSRFDD